MEIIATVIAAYGATYSGGYALGEYAYNHGYSRGSFKLNIISAIGTLSASFALGYDNGYVAASKA